MDDVAWFPLTHELTKPPGKARMSGAVLVNTDAEHFEILYRLPIPTMKGNKRLHIDGAQLGVYSADPMNYVQKFHVNRASFNDINVFAKVDEPITMKMMKTHMFPAIDVSNYESVTIRVWCSVSDPAKIALTTAMLHCYYA